MRLSYAKRFLFQLARQLGWVNPYAMARTIPAKLIGEWEAFAALEPFAETRADIHAAQITAMLYNINRDSKKDPDGKQIKDFVIDFDRDEVEAEKQRRAALENKFRVAELIMRVQSEVAAEQRAQEPGKVVEFHYPKPDVPATTQPVPVDDRIAAVLSAARAAMKDA